MEADFVVIGSGSAGSAIAFRLAEAGASVIVLEYGGTDIGPFIQMPAALSFPMNMKRYDWGYESEPEPHLGNRRLVTPRGKVIGGSSSINGMVYVRGHARDFDTWDKMGAKGWAYKDVLPYFKRMENWDDGGHGGDPSWRGTDGPLHVTRGKRDNPLHGAFVKAASQAGYQTTDDYNGEKQEGFGPFDQTVYRGRRWSTANAYLKPALKKFDCRLVHGLVDKVEIENGVAIGVRLANGEMVRARREFVLCAGAINSPQILLRSGVGPADELKALGIEVVANRQGVGKNLQDHLEVYMQMAASQPVTLYKHWNLFSKALIGAQWLLTKKGLGASNQFETTGFIRSRAGVEYPDIQYHFLPLAVRYDGKAAAEGHGFQAHTGPMRAKSRGEVTLKAANAKAAPRIFFNYMSHEEDWWEFRNAIRLTREIFAQDALKPFVKHAIQPSDDLQSDDEIDGFIRQHAESAYHPCGTCRMGAKDDKMAVVDPENRVIGVRNLRLADSSIFPIITNGNLNGPSIMTGEKAADHILNKTPLSPSNAEPWINPNWQTQQR